MKIIYTISIFTIATLLSCNTVKSTSEKKQDTIENKVETSPLIGKWRLNKISGGLLGKEQNAPTDQVTVLEFTKNEIITFINGKEIKRIKYTLGNGKSIHRTEPVPMIFSSESTKGQSYTIDGNTLGMSQEFYDGFYYTYIKVNE
jgi:hypothetical protein